MDIFKNGKIKVVLKCLKWQENWSKIFFGIFDPPPKINGGKKTFWVKNKQHQSCSKLLKMARKIIGNDSWKY